MAVAAPGQLNLDQVPLWPCGPRSIHCFQKLEQIGQGTHGQVFKAKEIETGEIVAVKKIIMINEIHGLPRSAIREIKILQKLDHQNVIRLKEIVTSPVDGDKYKGSIYMVFDYMDHDLCGLLRTGIRFSIPQIKCYMRQLLTGLQYCHDNKVLHRDIKGSNLLIDNEGNLKLADFGLAKFLSDELIIFITRNYETKILTNCVITLQYRPPELLLGSTEYGPEVDMWSVGCVFAELLLGKPIFPGEDEMDQLKKIFEICGTPDENNWPGVTQMLLYNNAMVQQRPMERCIGEVFQNFDHYALDLLDKMLTLDPKKRISEKDALDAEYFSTDPLPCDPKSLPKYETSHIFQQRQQEEAARRQMLSHFPPRQPSDLPCSPRRPSPNQPIHGSRPPMAAGGPSHRYDEPARPSGGPNWYQQGGSDSHGSSYSRDPYPSQGCRPPSYAGNHMSGAGGSRGNSGPSHYYDTPPRPPGGPNQYQQGASASGCFNPNLSGLGSSYSRDSYLFQGLGPPSYCGSDMSCVGGSRGASSSGGYGDGGPNYPQGGQHQHGARGQGSSSILGRHPSHGCRPPSYGGSDMSGVVGSRGASSSGGYGDGGPNYPQGGQHQHGARGQGSSSILGRHPSHGCRPPSYGGSDMSGVVGSRGASSSGGYGDSGPNWYQPPMAAGGSNQPMRGSQLHMAAGCPSHHYNMPPRPYGGPNWYQQGASTSQGSSYSRERYPSQGRGPPSYGGSDMSGAGGSRGASNSGGYGDSGPNYLQGGQYESSGPGCGPWNTRNQ